MKFSLEKYMAEVVILVNALISNLLQSLRHSALLGMTLYLNQAIIVLLVDL